MTPVVSIHAPARGATCERLRVLRAIYRSFNPRARAGRDHGIATMHVPSNCFNPRARAGRDLQCLLVRLRVMEVSIHAPRAGRDASMALMTPLIIRGFNPRARAGRDHGQPLDSQSTTPCFNPRARAGRDRHVRPMNCIQDEFQSTRPRGARPAS